MITLDTSKGQLVPYVFGQDALAASQTDVQLPTAIGEGSQAVDGYVMPFKGDIVAVAWSSSAAATAGSASVGASINGTEDADTTLTVTTQTNRVKKVHRGVAPIAASARLGCELTTNSGWDGTSADVTVTIYVLHQLEGI